MATHENVAKAWKEGKPAKGFNMNTDGKDLYSYNMLIGRTLDDGTKQALNVTGYYSYSTSTSKHVNYAKRYADEIVEPISENSWRYFPENGQNYTVRYTTKVWKTYLGAEKNMPVGGKYFASNVGTNEWSIVMWKYISKTGHVIDYSQWLSELEPKEENRTN